MSIHMKTYLLEDKKKKQQFVSFAEFAQRDRESFLNERRFSHSEKNVMSSLRRKY